VSWAATNGAVSALGLFTPSASGTATITATSTEDSTKSGSTSVAVSLPVPSVTSISSTIMAADGKIQTITINGSNFQSGDSVQLEWTQGSSSGQWTTTGTAPTIVNANEMTAPINPGTVTDTISLRVCNLDGVCSSGSQSFAAYSCVLPSNLPTAPFAYGGSTYHSFGDSITAGFLLANPQNAYPYLIGENLGFAVIDYAISGSQACDLAPVQFFPNNENPSISSNMLYSVMIGTNDSARNIAGYTAIFSKCYQAAVAWLAVPSDLKVRVNAPGVTTYGPGAFDTYNNWDSWTTSAQGSSITFPITLSSARPAYIWTRIIDGETGTFSYSLDGVVVGNSTTGTSPSISTNNGTTSSMQLLRIPSVPAGSHTITLTQTSSTGTMRVVGIGVPPDTQQGGPVVLASDIPYSLNTAGTGCSGTATPSLLYIEQIENAVELLNGDALNITFIPTRDYMFGTSAELEDNVHPNEVGHRELSNAFQSGLK